MPQGRVIRYAAKGAQVCPAAASTGTTFFPAQKPLLGLSPRPRDSQGALPTAAWLTTTGRVGRSILSARQPG